jgi:hypothetical protein
MIGWMWLPRRVEMRKFWELLDSFAFNVTLSIASLAAIATNLVSMIAARSFAPGGVWIIIWAVIGYHYISLAYKQYRESLRENANNQ